MARATALTYEQEVQIRLLYAQGGHSYRSLAKAFGVSKSKIDAVIKNPEPKPQTIEIVRAPEPERPSPLESLQDFTADPILFRIQKLTQIEMDIGNLSARGTNPASLYKIQIDLHDQITEMRRAAGDIQGEEDEQQLLMMIEQAVIAMSPVQREGILRLLGEYDNVVGIK